MKRCLEVQNPGDWSGANQGRFPGGGGQFLSAREKAFLCYSQVASAPATKSKTIEASVAPSGGLFLVLLQPQLSGEPSPIIQC